MSVYPDSGTQTMPEESNARPEDLLARHQFEIERMKDALALLGVVPCFHCRKFLRRTEPGAIFDAGELICYGCIPEWWPQRSGELESKERDNIEGKLVFWLREFHHAETFKDPAKLPEASLQQLQIVATCLECRGAGKLGEDRCRYCEGRGTVWVIVSRKKS